MGVELSWISESKSLAKSKKYKETIELISNSFNNIYSLRGLELFSSLNDVLDVQSKCFHSLNDSVGYIYSRLHSTLINKTQQQINFTVYQNHLDETSDLFGFDKKFQKHIDNLDIRKWYSTLNKDVIVTIKSIYELLNIDPEFKDSELYYNYFKSIKDPINRANFTNECKNIQNQLLNSNLTDVLLHLDETSISIISNFVGMPKDTDVSEHPLNN